MLQHCQAGCENSEQCGPGLVCFDRVDENMDVPGCDDKKLQSGAKSYCVYENDVSNVQVNNWEKTKPRGLEIVPNYVMQLQLVPPAKNQQLV